MRILLVEDNPGDARLIELLLDEAREAGRLATRRLERAATVRDATILLDDSGFDVILLDLSLPDAHGQETFLRIRNSAPDLPIVALTGNDDEQLAQELVAAGAQDYLVKGQVDARVLARALRYAIERKRSEEKLRLAAQVFEIALEGIVVTDAGQTIISVNRAFTDLTGFLEGEVNGRRIFPDAGDAGLFRPVWASQSGAEHWQGEAICRRAAGADFPVWLNVSAVKNAAGRVTHHVAACSDITALKRTEERLRHQAHHDALTGLPNRILFQDRLEQAQALARRNRSLVALLFIDLDRFKIINDTLGHACGDALLKTAAERLRDCVREVDTVARLGGDEFAIVISDLASPEDAARVASKALAALARPFELEGQELFVTSSIGIGLHDLSVDPENEAGTGLMERADIAMYYAKRTGRNSFQFYAPQMDAMSQQHLALETDLRRAVEQKEFILHYQPQVDPAGGGIMGVEALIRWRHPARGLVPPADFIPLLEDTGLIVPVGEWVMRTACRQAMTWLAEGLPPLRMAVNLSARQLHSPDLVERVAAILAESGLPAELLEIELTESIVMENTAEAADVLARLKQLGVRIALDDFGTGASSLGYLKHFPIDTLKISSAIIVDVERKADAAIAGAVIALARNLMLDSVAEGVETESQLDFLKRERCDSIQGFLISRPLPAEALRELLKSA